MSEETLTQAEVLAKALGQISDVLNSMSHQLARIEEEQALQRKVIETLVEGGININQVEEPPELNRYGR